MTLFQLVIVFSFFNTFIRRTNAWFSNARAVLQVDGCCSFVDSPICWCVNQRCSALGISSVIFHDISYCIFWNCLWEKMMKYFKQCFINDIININNIPSSYIFEHIQATCLLTERLILLTVAIPMELFSWLRVGAQSTSLVKYINWLTYSGKYLKYDLNQLIT